MSWRQHATAAHPRRKRSLKKDGTPRARPIDHEGQEQAVLIRWLLGEKQRRSPVGELYDVTYHVPNGGQRNKKTAADLKRQGVKSGVSDLVVMDPRGGFHGLYLEFKATPPRHAAVAKSQEEWLALADERGYCALLALGLEEAKRLLQWYASLPETVASVETAGYAFQPPPPGTDRIDVELGERNGDGSTSNDTAD